MKWNTENAQLSTKINNNTKYSNGNVLNATALNATIDEVLVASELLGALFGKDLVSIMINNFPQTNWNQSHGYIHNTSITIQLGSIPVYATCELQSGSFGTWTDKIKAEITNQSHQIVIKFTELEPLSMEIFAGIYKFLYTIHFYLDETKSKLISKKTGIISYTCSPYGPTD